MRVGHDAAAWVELHARFAQAQIIRIRTPADGDEDDIRLEHLLLSVRRLDIDAQAVALLVHAGHFGRQEEFHTLALQETLELLRDFAVEARRDAVEEFDDRHVAAETSPHRSQFEPDIAAADHEQPLRYVLERQRAGRRHNALFVDGDTGKRHHVGARRDNDILGGKRARRTVGKLDRDLTGACDARFAHDAFDLVLLEEELDALGEFADDLRLVRHHGGEIEAHLRLDAELGEFLAGRFVVKFARVQQRLGRNAADVEAGAAELAALVHAGSAHAQLSGTDRGVVAARSAANDHDVESVTHGSRVSARGGRFGRRHRRHAHARGGLRAFGQRYGAIDGRQRRRPCCLSPRDRAAHELQQNQCGPRPRKRQRYDPFRSQALKILNHTSRPQ